MPGGHEKRDKDRRQETSLQEAIRLGKQSQLVRIWAQGSSGAKMGGLSHTLAKANNFHYTDKTGQDNRQGTFNYHGHIQNFASVGGNLTMSGDTHATTIGGGATGSSAWHNRKRLLQEHGLQASSKKTSKLNGEEKGELMGLYHALRGGQLSGDGDENVDPMNHADAVRYINDLHGNAKDYDANVRRWDHEEKAKESGVEKIDARCRNIDFDLAVRSTCDPDLVPT